MILKSYEINKINLLKNRYLLLYGVNEGAKSEFTTEIVRKSKIQQILKFDEKQILENENILFTEVYSKSLFDNEKIIIINRASEKILKILNEFIDLEIKDLLLIVNANNLEKKSKMRNLFEKGKKLLCIPFYADNSQTLSKLAFNFFLEKKIKISQSDVNLLVNKCNGDRGVLRNELNKIELFLLNKKTIDTKSIIKLTNLIENHDVSELIDNCLAKNHKKTINILNDNIYTNEDSILISRTLLNKSKRILKLLNEFQKNKNIDLTISSAKPPIFWKDKEIIIKQIHSWTPEKIKKLIFRLSEIELLIKKNINNSNNLITDFILEQSFTKPNN